MAIATYTIITTSVRHVVSKSPCNIDFLRYWTRMVTTTSVTMIISTAIQTLMPATIPVRGRAEDPVIILIVTILVGVLHSASPVEEIATAHVTSGVRS